MEKTELIWVSVIILGVFAWILIRLAKRRHHPPAPTINYSPERERRRRMQQMEVGDPIFRTLVDAWEWAGEPEDRKVFRTTVVPGEGSYKIKVGREESSPTLTITIDNRLRLHEQVKLEGELLRNFNGPEKNLSATESLQWVRAHLLRLIFPSFA